MQQPDVCIAGAGIMGIALALELTRRGARVTILDRGPALAESSTAAAGMLAANDPHNPPALAPLSALSISLYPAFLAHLANLSDIRVAFQTDLTLQATDLPSIDSVSRADLDIFVPGHNLGARHLTLLDEHSIDPRELATALLAAVANTSIQLFPGTPVVSVESSSSGIAVITADTRLQSRHFVDCTGAWALTCPELVTPRKGQLLSVALPQTAPLPLVLRTENLYIVPRTHGAGAGRAIIGATVEDSGLDKTVHPADIDRLRAQAVDLLPGLSSAPVLEQWSGLRPGTRDDLPLLGPMPSSPNHLFATGHFRNGILLAPATAHLLAEIILGQQPEIDLAPFSPARFVTESIA